MGGYGSGRPRNLTALYQDRVLRIEVHGLVKEWVQTNNRIEPKGDWATSDFWRVVTEIEIQETEPALGCAAAFAFRRRLLEATGWRYGEKILVNLYVQFLRSGGKTFYFICPGHGETESCGRRVRHLYGDLWSDAIACQHCLAVRHPGRYRRPARYGRRTQQHHYVPQQATGISTERRYAGCGFSPEAIASLNAPPKTHAEVFQELMRKIRPLVDAAPKNPRLAAELGRMLRERRHPPGYDHIPLPDIPFEEKRRRLHALLTA